MTYILTKVQDIGVEFTNECLEKKLKHTLPDFKKAESAIQRQAFHLKFSSISVEQRQVFDIIDPFLIQPVIPIIYNGCGVTSHFYPALHIFEIFFQIIIDSLQSCALFIMTSQRKNTNTGQKYTKTITICSKAIFKMIFLDQMQTYLFIQLNYES